MFLLEMGYSLLHERTELVLTPDCSQQLLLRALTYITGINPCCFRLPFGCIWNW